MRTLRTSLLLTVVLTLLTGVLYPLAVTGLAKLMFPRQAAGSLIERDGIVVGSELIGQKFEAPGYFWPRPSAVDYHPQPSGGSNLGPASADLKAKYDERKEKLATSVSSASSPPQDLLFASASGLDPDISINSARYQIPRVLKSRGLSEADGSRVEALIVELSQERQLGMLGEPRINVLRLNLALDATFKGK